jgi:hypothetical protein
MIRKVCLRPLFDKLGRQRFNLGDGYVQIVIQTIASDVASEPDKDWGS